MKAKKRPQSKSEGKNTGKKHEPDLKEVRRRVIATICPNVIKITKSVVAQAESGNYLVAKFLFELLGIFPPPEEEETEKDDDSLARYLLKSFGIPDPDVPTPAPEDEEAVAEEQTPVP